MRYATKTAVFRAEGPERLRELPSYGNSRASVPNLDSVRLLHALEITHKQVATIVSTHNPNSVHPKVSTVKDCRHLDIVACRAQFVPVRVLCIIPAAVPFDIH